MHGHIKRKCQVPLKLMYYIWEQVNRTSQFLCCGVFPCVKIQSVSSTRDFLYHFESRAVRFD